MTKYENFKGTTEEVEILKLEARIDEYENHFPHRRMKKTVWAVTESDIRARIAELTAQLQALKQKARVS